MSCERNTLLCIFRFCFLVCRLFLARRDSVLLQWSLFNRTRDGPGQNKHATQTRTITNRTAAKLIFFLFPTAPMSNSSQQLAPWYDVFPDTSKRNSLLYGCSKTTNASTDICSFAESSTFSQYIFFSKQFSVLQY